jgi:hypothetical protein
MKLGTLLLRDGIINLDQLEAALRAQVLFGGRLGTNLVELGHLSIDQLTTYLARTLGLPAATQAMFEEVEARTLELVPRAVIEKHLVFPLRVEPGDPPTLCLAIADPRDRAAVAAVERAAGVRVALHVAPELRILFYLERSYGVSRKPRFVRPGAATEARPPAEERRRVLDTEAAPVNIQPRRAATAPGLATVTAAGATPALPATSTQPVPAPAVSPAAVAAAAPSRPLSLAATLEQLEAAGSRDAIAEAVLAFARGRVEAAVLFFLREGMAIGWRGFAPGVDAATIEAISLPLAPASCLASAYEYRMPWRGAPGAAGKSLDPTLFMKLRHPNPPDEVLTAPVLIGQRVVNLVYVHGHAGAALDEGLVDGIVSVAEAAGEAFARLIQAKRGH